MSCNDTLDAAGLGQDGKLRAFAIDANGCLWQGDQASVDGDFMVWHQHGCGSLAAVETVAVACAHPLREPRHDATRTAGLQQVFNSQLGVIETIMTSAQTCSPTQTSPKWLPLREYTCICTCMATKTISIDTEAYDKLRRARTRPSESFSQVIKRGHWERPRSTAAALLEQLESTEVPKESTLEYLEQAQRNDEPPHSRWTE